MIGGTLVVFVPGMPEGEKQDIQDCLLYAEVFANRGAKQGGGHGCRIINMRC